MPEPSAPSELLYCTDTGSGPPLLLIHALMASGRMFDPVKDHLAARHRLIVPDLRGFGKSRVLPAPYTMVQHADDLARLLDHLEIESTAVLGYSQGGAVAQQFARNHPGRCDRLILGSTFAHNMATRREWVEGHVVPLLLRLLGPARFARLVVAAGTKQLDPDSQDWLVGLLAAEDKKLSLFAWKESMTFDSRVWLSEIRCPTLIVAGSKDAGVPMHHAYMLRDGIPDSRLTMIEGGDHTFLWAHTPEFLRIVDEFLDE